MQVSSQFNRKKVDDLGTPVLGESPSSIFLTLGKGQVVTGPIRHKDGLDDPTYVNAIFDVILHQADQKGQTYLNENNPQAYLSFLVGSIVMPFNESKLQQFRTPVGNDYCSVEMNNGTALERAGGLELFNKYLKPNVPTCNDVPASEIGSYTQLISGFDTKSFGIGQEDFQMHKDFLQSGDYLRVDRSALDAISLYFEGFDKVLRKITDRRYGCLRTDSGETNWVNVVRGAWSGPYNSGSVASDKVCRFVDSFDKGKDAQWNKENDVPFGVNYQDVLDSKNGFLARTLTGAELAEYQTLIDSFLELGTPALPDTASITPVALALQQQIQNPTVAPAPTSAPANAPSLAPAAPLIADGKDLVTPPVKQVSVISEAGEVVTRPPTALRFTMPRTMYVHQQAELFLTPTLDEAAFVANLTEDAFAVSALKRVDTRLGRKITAEWIEIEMPDNKDVADQIEKRNQESATPGSGEHARSPIRPGTHLYVQAAELDSIAGKIKGHFEVNIHSGTLNLRQSGSTAGLIDDFAAKGELLEATDSQPDQSGQMWYQIYSPGGSVWASGRYLIPVEPKHLAKAPEGR